MKIREFLKIMKRRKFKIKRLKNQIYTLTKNNQKYFLRKYNIICIYDINNFNINDFKEVLK